MSAIDDYIEHMTKHAPGHATLTIDARDEITKLRSELDAFRAKANVSICAWCGQECEKESGAIAEHVIVCEKRPEHAMLVKFEELLHTVAEQARQIEAARELLDLILKNSREVSEGDCIYCNCEQGGGNEHDCYYDCPMNDVRAWLAANAPTQGETEGEA